MQTPSLLARVGANNNFAYPHSMHQVDKIYYCYFTIRLNLTILVYFTSVLGLITTLESPECENISNKNASVNTPMIIAE